MKVSAFIKEYYKPFIIFFAIICAALLTAGCLVFFITPGSKEADIPETVTLNYNGVKTEAEGDSVWTGSSASVDAVAVGRAFGMKVGGTSEVITLSTDDGESMTFTSGSREADINGVTVLLDEAPEIDGQSVIVPLEFIETYFRGIEIKVADDLSEIEITRENGYTDEICFVLKNDTALGKVDRNGHPVVMTIDESELEYEFIGDYSSVKKYLNPENRDDYLVLACPSSPQSSTYEPTGLTVITRLKKGLAYKYELVTAADKALSAMLSEMDAAGITGMYAVRGYVSYTELQKNYNSALAKGNYAPKPGESDHLTGLGVDITNEAKAAATFADTDAYRWLQENAYKFGFIERYPSGAEAITGCDAEPCHWRFVGQYHAAIMHREGMCLEEYASAIGLIQ